MALIDWFARLPPASLTDSGIKMLIYLIIIFTFLSAIVVFFTTKAYRKKEPSLLDLDLETDLPTPSDIPASERIAILQIEKAKFVAGQRALSDASKRKEISEQIFGRLSVRYASDVKKIEEEIEKTTREAEVSQLEEELKKMQGDYLSKIKGEEKIETPPTTPATAPPAPPAVVKPAKPPKPEKVKAPKEKKKKKEKAVAKPPTPPAPATTGTAPPSPPMPGRAAPPPPPGVATTPPATAVPSPPMPTPPPSSAPASSIPAPTIPTPKPLGTGAPPAAPSATGEGEGDLFAKSTSIAALRKEMLKELDRLKKFMSEQQ